MLTPDERASFQSRGVIRLRSFLPGEKVARARDVVLNRLQQEGIWREGAWILGERAPSPLPENGTKLVAGLSHREEIADLIGEEVYPVVAELLDGRAVFPLVDRAQFLVTLPNAASWTVPYDMWHLDIPRLPDGDAPGVQLFTFLERVAPGGGGTLVVAGSHRLLNEGRRISSPRVKKRLKREPYFRDLMSRAFTDRLRFVREPGRVGDVELSVVELHGEPGDVYLTDLRLLHTVAPNATAAPRIMLTHRFLLESVREAVFAPGGSREVG